MANPEMQRDFVATQGAKLPPKSKGKGNPLLRGKPLKPVSDKQAIRTAFLQGVKAERIRAMFEGRGGAYCERCDRETYGADTDEPEWYWLEAAMPSLDGHHIHPRSRGTRYKGAADHGIDTPFNITLVCRRCHDELEAE